MNISHLLMDRRKSLFVGRERELALLQQTITDPDWQLLHIHGPGGIGKTSLLRLFAQSNDSSRFFYFDGHSGFRQPENFLSKVQEVLNDPGTHTWTEVIALLNQYAVQHQGIILLLDTFEQWGAIENWLRNDFFHKLCPLVKVIIAGRYPLKDQWLRGDWHMLLLNVELKPLTSIEVQKYVNRRGIENRDIVDALLHFSRGVPLALSLACEIIVRRGTTSFLDQPQQKQLIGYLAGELMNDIDDSALSRYMEAASVVWKFDQDLLQALIQEHIPTSRFREFCELPFVIKQENNWTLHDSVRQWIFTDFRNRMPQSFGDYRKRAFHILREREHLQPDKKAEFAFEKIYLHEDDFVRSFCFQWDDSLIFRECNVHDLEQVEHLYIKYLQAQPNYIPGEDHLEPLIRPLWNIDPTSFFGLWEDQRLVAFCSCIPLTEQTVEIFRKLPLTTPATSNYDPNQRQFIICIAGVEPQLESEISGSVARAMVKIIDRHAFIINLISMPFWIQYLPVLGFDRASWADSITELGVEYKGFQLDLRLEDFPMRIDRIFATLDSAIPLVHVGESPSEIEMRLPMEEAVKLVQRALKHYSRLPLHPEISDSLQNLLSDNRLNMKSEVIAEQLQAEIQVVMQKLSTGTKEEQRSYQILHYAYIQKIGTHEMVAEYLHFPAPSYFRYLRTAVRKLAYELIRPRT